MTARHGSVLMETVIVLPVWLTIFAGIMRLGERGVDSLRLKEADRTAAIVFASRSGDRSAVMPTACLTRLFHSEGKLRGIVQPPSAQVALKDTKSWTMMTGSGASIWGEDRYLFWEAMFNAVGDDEILPDLGNLTSSRKGKAQTWFCLVPSKNSINTRRHWDASLIVDKDIWKFNGEDKDTEYPQNWDANFFESGKHSDDGMKWRDEPSPKKVYERFGTFVNWSES